jgi:shikimate kinase
MTPECAEIVKEQTCGVYLRASIETLMEHLSGKADGRPMLSGSTLHKRITELMAQRAETYEKTANVIIDTDGKSIEAVASDIVSMLNL